MDRFIEKRLLVADTDPHGEITVSVAHEALPREWVRVKSWLAGNREFLRMRDRLDSSLRLWLSRGKQKDDLLGPGLPVAEGERLLKEFAASLSREEIDYIKASTAERKRREQARARRFQVAAAVLFVLLCAALVGAYLGITGRTEAERQREEAKKTAALADCDLSSFYLDRTRLTRPDDFDVIAPDWPEALAHLARGLRTEPEKAILRQSSVSALTSNQWYFPSTEPLHHDGAVNAASFSPDGTRIVTASQNHTARIWDGKTGKPISQPFHHYDSVETASFSPDGTRIVTASYDHTARIWDVAVDLEAPLPEWFPVLLEALGGKRLNEQGSLVDAEHGLLEVRQQLVALKGDEFWSRLGRWFVTPGPERTISPNSTVTVQEWENNQLKATSD